jgi:putative peptidoglycan lipid II flippase
MKNVYKSYTIILLISIGIKLFDVLKNILIASNLGVSSSADIFMGIISIPDSLIVLVGLDSIKGVVNSEYASLESTERKEKVMDSFSNIFSIISLISLFFVIIFIIFREQLIDILLPGFALEKKVVASQIALIIFPVFFFKSIIGMLQAFMNALKKFYYPALLNSLPTFFMIAAIFLPFYKNDLIYNLSFSVIISNFFVFIFSLLFLQRVIGLVKIKKIKFDTQTKQILKGCTSLIFLLLSEQIFNVSKNFLASYFGEGAISSLNYSRSVSLVIMGLIFSSIFSVLLSNMSSMFASDIKIKTRNLFTKTLTGLIFIVILLVVIFLISGREILSILYLRGKFDLSAIDMTMKPYVWEVMSQLSFIMYIIPVALFLSKKKYHTLNMIGSSVFISGIVVNLIAVKIFGYYGISIANFFVTSVYASILLYNSRFIFGKYKREVLIFLKLLFSGVVTFLAVYLIKTAFKSYATVDIIGNIRNAVVYSSIIVIVYLGFTYLLKVNYLMDFISMLKKK